MLCPSCKAANDEAAENCFKCGKGLFSLTEGSLLASRYEILSPLGKGGMGMVYKAHDRELDELVAIKVVRSEAAASPEMARRFRSEIKLARRVSHPNVCRIHELGKEGPLSYIVMEYVEGADFKRILREKGRLPPPEAYEVALQIADALQAIHGEGIIHRDLKTTNVMRNARGVVKLMDFGIAKSFEAGLTGATATGHVVGTPDYMSPEQALAGRIDIRSDIYALGIVTFELFTGNVPFHSDTPLATLFKQIHDPPPLEGTRELPGAVVPVLRRALAKESEKRFQSAREFREALRVARGQSFPNVPQTLTQTPMRAAVAPLLMPDTTPIPTPVTTAVPTVVPSAMSTAVSHEVALHRPAHASKARPLARSIGISLGAGVALGLLVGGSLLWMRGGEQRDGAPVEPTTAPSTTDQAAAMAPVAPVTEPSIVPTLEAPSPPAPREPASAKGLSIPRSPAPVRAPTPSPRVALPRPSPASTPQRPSPEPPAPTTPVVAPPTTALPDTSSQAGTLQLLVVPWAEVEVDGMKVGISPPLKPLSLPAGAHVIKLTHPDYLPFPRRVSIRPGETTKLQVDLTKEAFPKQSP